MKRLTQIWDRLDLSYKLGIGCFAFYMLLYVVLDILGALFNLAY